MSLIRVGQVNSVHPDKGTVDVYFPDKDIVATDLALMNIEYSIPQVEDQVLCVFLGNGVEQGFCLGGFYSSISKTPINDRRIYRKHFDDETYVEYKKEEKVLKVMVNDVSIEVNNGKVTIKSDEILLGSDSAAEGVPLGNQLKDWLDNHTHDYSWSDSAGSGSTSSPTSTSPAVSEKVKIE